MTNQKFDRKEYQRQWHIDNPVKGVPALYHNAKRRAKKKGIEFLLTKEDIVIPEVCPVLGIKIDTTLGGRGGKANSPSIDRKDNTKGYVKDNIVVMSWQANRLKNDATLEELERICDYIRSC